MAIVTRWKRINNYLDRREDHEQQVHLDQDIGGLSCHVYATPDPDDPGVEVYGYFAPDDQGHLELRIPLPDGSHDVEPDGADLEERFGDRATQLLSLYDW